MTILITIVVVLLLGTLTFMLIHFGNVLKRLRMKVKEARSSIDVALEKRYDLLNEEIAAVKKYLEHEYTTIMDATKVRMGIDEEEKKKREEAYKDIDRSVQELMENAKLYKKENAGSMGSSAEELDRMINMESSLAVGANSINALREQYPQLQSWNNMNSLQVAMQDVEENLQAARRLYNANVSLYNQDLICFPYNLIGSMLNMEQEPFYKVADVKREYTVKF